MIRCGSSQNSAAVTCSSAARAASASLPSESRTRRVCFTEGSGAGIMVLPPSAGGRALTLIQAARRVARQAQGSAGFSATARAAKFRAALLRSSRAAAASWGWVWDVAVGDAAACCSGAGASPAWGAAWGSAGASRSRASSRLRRGGRSGMSSPSRLSRASAAAVRSWYSSGDTVVVPGRVLSQARVRSCHQPKAAWRPRMRVLAGKQFSQKVAVRSSRMCAPWARPSRPLVWVRPTAR